MIRWKRFAALVMVLVPVLLAGCVDKNQLDRIEEGQKDILAKLEKIEEAQKNMPKAFQPQPQRPTIDFNQVHELPIGGSAIMGKKDAPVTIVEFSDFQCPYCARLQPTLKQVLDAYPNDGKLVYKDFPLSFHKQATNAAKAARAAGEQGKYWEMHDLIFKDYNTLADDSFKKYAEQLNLDVNRFMTDFQSTKYDVLIQADIALGRKVGVQGTPTLFLNGKRMQQRSFEHFKELIDAALKK